LAQNPDGIENPNWAAAGLRIHGRRRPGRRAVNAQSIPRRWCADLMLTTRASDTEPRRSKATIGVPMVLDMCLSVLSS
jgi:hypothetical protein